MNENRRLIFLGGGPRGRETAESINIIYKKISNFFLIIGIFLGSLT